MSTDQLVYRSKTGRKSRITLDFIHQLYNGMLQELSSPATLNFIEKTKIPNERELYGLLVKSLLTVGGKDEIGHVATEIQVSRSSDKGGEFSNSTGRVDVLVNYRTTVFLIEVKVARISVSGKNLKSGEHSKAAKAWVAGVRQLEEIITDKVQSRFNQDVKKIALLICVYYDGSTKARESGWDPLVSDYHQQICTHIEDKSIQPVDYELYSTFDQPIQTLLRKSNATESRGRAWLHGFSLFSADLE